MQTMTQILLGLALAICVSLGSAQQAESNPCPNVLPQATLDYDMYKGTWYEQYRLSEEDETASSCEQQVLITADTGDMILTESKQNGTALESVSLTVTVPDSNAPAKYELRPVLATDIPDGLLAVLNTVFPPLLLRVVETDYTTYSMVYLCPSNIQGGSEGVYIYSRDRAGLDDATVEGLKQSLQDMGVDLSTLTRTVQENCPTQ